jgi:hypothetical protein
MRQLEKSQGMPKRNQAALKMKIEMKHLVLGALIPP